MGWVLPVLALARIQVGEHKSTTTITHMTVNLWVIALTVVVLAIAVAILILRRRRMRVRVTSTDVR